MADKIVSWGGIDSKGTTGMGVTGSLAVSGSITTNADIALNSTSSRTSILGFYGSSGFQGTLGSSYHTLAVTGSNNFVWSAFSAGGYSTTPLTLSGGSNWSIPGNMKIGTITTSGIGSNGSYGGNYATLTITGGGYNDGTNPSINFITWDGGNTTSRFQIHSRTLGGGNGKIVAVPNNGNFIIGASTDLSAKLAVRGSGTTSSTTALLVQNANASASLQVLDNGNTGIGTAASATYKLNVSGSVYLTDGFNSDNDTVVVRKYTSGGTLMTIAGYSHYNSIGLSVSNAVGIIATAAGLGVSSNNNVGVGLVASGTQSGLGFALGAVLRRALIAKNTGTTGTSMYSAAALQIDGTDGGLLLPTLTTSQRNSLTAITSFSILTSGSGYTNGTYQNQGFISLIGGSGSLGRARVVVSGGSVTSVSTDTFWGSGGYGLGYQVGDIVSGSIAGGSGWTSQVTGVMVPQGLTVYNSDSKTVEVYNSSSWQPLITADYSGSTRLTGSSTISGSLTVSGSLIVSGSDITSGWTAYTPVWTAASVNPVIGNGTIEGYYKVIGKTCFVRGNVAMGSTTTFGSGEWYISMPFTASHADAILMTANLLDNGTAWYNATMNGARAGFTTKAPIQYQAAGGTANDVNATQPFTWANTDRFLWNGSYEIA
jgi:hypothetical protein